MTGVFIGFWTVMVFASIAWYAILLFIVGWKGGKDILRMARALAAERRADEGDGVMG
jgi:hypothetical protein